MRLTILILMCILSGHLFANDEFSSTEEWVQVGDMIVPVSSVVENGISGRAFKESRIRLWKNGILRYQFSNNLSRRDREEFLRYCAEVGEFADIQCLPRTSQDRDYIYVQRSNMNACGSSYLGRYGGRQPLKIRCWRRRTIQHELLHALGVSHEHNRPDRDHYIQMQWNNVRSSAKRSYRKVSISGISHRLKDYDFDSIMHYGSRSGANSQGLAFYRKDRGPGYGEMNQTNQLSYGDHYFLYHLYGGRRP